MPLVREAARDTAKAVGIRTRSLNILLKDIKISNRKTINNNIH